ncbi:immunity repressor [Gordonia phage BaxterFox]|uniref:Immunity repressor n=1 Tax=Gordonia phage BaxterFox TaxID=1821549 RepID=A0A142KCM0_9CAUD|nr:immunity repressor [Gordonia phage BaxterFox]AMS03853.1 immunity repressor [Gordonia phage BaxterFox]
MTHDPLVIEFLCDTCTSGRQAGRFIAMSEPTTLADFVELASQKHNNASGRRLAEIAAAHGYEVSHSTLNRIRRGTYGSVPTESVLKAVAYLAGVPEERVLSAPDASSGRRPDVIFDDWQRAKAKVLNLEIEYAMAREIPIDEAEDELSNVLQMVFDTRQGRPWTPPWRPGDAFDSDDEPWKSEWWATSTPISAADRFEEFGMGTPEQLERLRSTNEVIHQVSLGWTLIDRHGGLEEFLKWKRQQEETDDITTEPPTEVRTSKAPEGQKTRGRGSLPDKIRDAGERLTTTRTGRAVADSAHALDISQARESSDDVLRVSYDAPPSVRARAIRIEMDGSVHAEPVDIPVSAGTVEGALQELLDRYANQGFKVDTDTRAAADKGADLFAHGKQFDLIIELKGSGSQFGPPADLVQAARQYAMETRNSDVQAASDADDRQSDYELANRRGRGRTKGEQIREQFDRDAEAGDPEGPESGA